MSDEQHGWALLLPDASQLFLQRHARLRIDAGEWLVHQKNFRLVGQRPYHADALFHLFMPLDGTIDVTIEGEPSERLGPWQAHFFKGGTTHAFTNTSGSAVQWLEVFVQKTPTSADIDLGHALALAMASLSRPSALPEENDSLGTELDRHEQAFQPR